ncbi:hypothetical protein TNCV_1124801 [Trichonephila clavipes]|uniref:Uncharacterized protein n=1 Tax=Trichonephila clavipes TaxID=2585209 RepID=A0A8X6VKS7_TRICX|nr:hypothetical protein TNCV_1124801 [Trichonephila clavipes]
MRTTNQPRARNCSENRDNSRTMSQTRSMVKGMRGGDLEFGGRVEKSLSMQRSLSSEKNNRGSICYTAHQNVGSMHNGTPAHATYPGCWITFCLDCTAPDLTQLGFCW